MRRWLNDERKPRNFWGTKQNVIDESKKYTTRSEFKEKSQSAYEVARKNNWLDDMTWLTNNDGRKPKGYWKIRENIMSEAMKYKTKGEFQEKSLTAFLAAYKYGYIDEMEWLVTRKHHKWGYWTYKTIEAEAMKYNTKTEFFNGSQTAYKAALKLGIIDDFFSFNNYVQ